MTYVYRKPLGVVKKVGMITQIGLHDLLVAALLFVTIDFKHDCGHRGPDFRNTSKASQPYR